MKAGDLNCRVTLKARSAGQDSAGQAAITWTTVATLWASVRPLKIREQLLAQQVRTDVTHVVELRYSSYFADPKAVATYRLELGSRIFNILGADIDDHRREKVTLHVSEGLNDG